MDTESDLIDFPDTGVDQIGQPEPGVQKENPEKEDITPY